MEKLCIRKPSSLMECRALVMQLCHTYFEDLGQKVIADLHILLEEGLRQNGGHATYIVY